MSKLDKDTIKYAVDTARERGYRQVKLRLGDSKFSATLGVESAEPIVEEVETDVAVVESSDVEAAPAPSVVETEIKAEGVGYFKATDPAVAESDAISSGDKVGEIMAVGMANDITSSVDGSVLEVLVNDGDAVEYGQVLMKVAKS